MKYRTSLVAQGLRLFASTKRGAGLIPRWGTKTPMLCSQKKKSAGTQDGGNLNSVGSKKPLEDFKIGYQVSKIR